MKGDKRDKRIYRIHPSGLMASFQDLYVCKDAISACGLFQVRLAECAFCLQCGVGASYVRRSCKTGPGMGGYSVSRRPLKGVS